MQERPRVLGVDDSLTIRKALELVLRPAGYDLELAATGTEAVDTARQFQPAVILLDFILPDMRGTEVCRRLAAEADTASVPVVLISAKGAEIRQAYQDVDNVVGFIAKPFTPETLIDTLADVIARSQAGELVLQPKSAEGAPAPIDLTSEAPVEEPAAAIGEWQAAAPPVPPEPGAVELAVPTNGVGEVTDASCEAPPPSEAQMLPDEGAATDAPREPAPAPSAESPDLEADSWEEADDEEESEEEVHLRVPRELDLVRREALDLMFDTLGASLEGVYVEEVDTPDGAAADEAKSYTDLAAQVARQLGEALAQARSGERFSLCSDGSIRSLDEVLFDAYRRVCRLLLRAATAGAVQQGPSREPTRVLVVCHHDSPSFAAMRDLLPAGAERRVLFVHERFRQIPALVRMYGPALLFVDGAGSAAAWDQLALVEQMAERRRLRVVAVLPRGASADKLHERVDEVLELDGEQAIERVLDGEMEAGGAGGGESALPVALAG